MAGDIELDPQAVYSIANSLQEMAKQSFDPAQDPGNPEFEVSSAITAWFASTDRKMNALKDTDQGLADRLDASVRLVEQADQQAQIDAQVWRAQL